MTSLVDDEPMVEEKKNEENPNFDPLNPEISKNDFEF